jgi:aspartyl-tRNA(Asn)/glutamyl-tRNA(Gln) amidotransferase subunit B
MKWEVVIGLETHAQLSTASKMFSGAATAFGAPPNTQACAVDVALPGVLPVLNRRAVECAIRFGLAVNGMSAGNINRRSIFARKNYFYPDLPKGYQISQYEMPIVRGGTIGIYFEGREKQIRLTRAHLEEDAGKSLHEGFHDFSGIDLNRAGTPLLEIVSEPDMRSAEEAVAYAKALHSLVRWIDICDGNMQEGSFRCDANVSVRRPGAPLGTRREIKNLNSFRFLQQAIEYESRWQIETLEDGGAIEQATVLFDPDTGKTHPMRTKEEAHDYRYFPDPDLLPLFVAEDWIRKIQHELPELPQAKQERYQREFGLSPYDSLLLTGSRGTAEYFEDLVARLSRGQRSGELPEAAKLAANWVAGELSAALNRDNLEIERSPISSEVLGWMLSRIRDKTISNKIAKEQVFPDLWKGLNVGVGAPVLPALQLQAAGGTNIVDQIIASKGATQISDSNELERICDEVIGANPKQVADYRAGKDKAFNSLVGQVMKATKGKANPQQVNDILKRKLSV